MNVLEDFELFLVAMAMIELLKARLVKETHNSQMQLVDHLMSHFVLIRHTIDYTYNWIAFQIFCLIPSESKLQSCR